MLPSTLPVEELPEPEGENGLRIAIGLDENELAPVWHDFAENPHLIVVGDTESGKTNLLKLVARGITERYTPAEARIMTVDYRRELVESVPEAYRLGHAVSLDMLRDLVDGAARAVRQRVPGRTSLRRGCGCATGGRGRGCSSWSTTTTWWAAGR